MSVGAWFKRLFSSPSEGAETDAALHEEYRAPDAGEADLKFMEETGGGGGTTTIRYGAMDAAEAGEDDLQSEEAPPDMDP